MNLIDWDAKAVLQQRDDAGSDMFFAFDTIGEGTLAQMIGQAMRMQPMERARLVLDVAGRGMLDVRQIVELSQRPDYPGAED